MSPHERAALLIEELDLPGVVPVARHPVAPRPHALGLRALRLETRCAIERRGDLRRAKHRLRRHACEVRALAAHEATLDKRQLDLGVEPAEGPDEVLAGGPSAQYHYPH